MRRFDGRFGIFQCIWYLALLYPLALHATVFVNSFWDDLGLLPGDQAWPMHLQRCPDGGYALLVVTEHPFFLIHMARMY